MSTRRSSCALSRWVRSGRGSNSRTSTSRRMTIAASPTAGRNITGARGGDISSDKLRAYYNRKHNRGCGKKGGLNAASIRFGDGRFAVARLAGFFRDPAPGADPLRDYQLSGSVLDPAPTPEARVRKQ